MKTTLFQKKVIRIRATALTCVLLMTSAYSGKNSDKRVYSEKEFEQAVIEEAAKRLKRVQVSNLSSFSRDLLKKESELNRQEKALRELEQQLAISTKDFINRVKKFESKQQKFLGCLNENEKDKGERVSRLVKVIAGMKARKAAELLSIQDSELAVQILSNLDPAKTSKIFNLMEKEISARLQKQYLVMKQ